jgi:ABC-2 type transport system permease protein
MSKQTSSKRKGQQRQAILRLVILVVILVFVNILASNFHRGLDLTREKRFTLTDATKRMLKGMDDVAVVNVYLEGKFPAGIERLSEATLDKLRSFREYGGNHIAFRFIDPFEGKAESEKEAIANELYAKGIQPVSLNVANESGNSQQFIFPYALVVYKGKSMPVKLLETHFGMNDKEQLNYSENLLEYKLASAIHKLEMPAKPGIAYIMGHGEPLGPNTYDLLKTLEQYYKVDTIDLPNEYHINDALYKAIIINKPTETFTEKEKFKIDQFIMHGGRVLWAIDKVKTPIDTLQKTGQALAMDYNLDLDDQLFRYGARINSDLVEDVSCNMIPFISGTMDNGQPQIELRPWVFMPLFIPENVHPIVNNMDVVMGQFASSIDTIADPGIKKTVLLRSSNYSRTSPTPVRVSLSMLNYNPDPKLFRKPYQPVAVLLEGKFTSLFQNRMAPEFLRVLKDSLKYEFKSSSDSATAMVVISDGEIMWNDFSRRDGPMELGYWQFTKSLFANKNFILNCLEYLTDPNSLLEARSKDLKLRLLDSKRASDEKLKWQAINIGIPLALVLIFASAYLFFRKRRYEVKG